jgi:class 3 adenylate cyclase
MDPAKSLLLIGESRSFLPVNRLRRLVSWEFPRSGDSVGATLAHQSPESAEKLPLLHLHVHVVVHVVDATKDIAIKEDPLLLDSVQKFVAEAPECVSEGRHAEVRFIHDAVLIAFEETSHELAEAIETGASAIAVRQRPVPECLDVAILRDLLAKGGFP